MTRGLGWAKVVQDGFRAAGPTRSEGMGEMHPTTVEYLARAHLRDLSPDPRLRHARQGRARPDRQQSVKDRVRRPGLAGRLVAAMVLLTGHR